MKVKKFDEIIEENLDTPILNEEVDGHRNIKINNMSIKFAPTEKIGDHIVSNEGYYLEFETNEGIFHQRVNKYNEPVDDDNEIQE